MSDSEDEYEVNKKIFCANAVQIIIIIVLIIMVV